MRRISVAVLFGVLLLTAVCGADPTRKQSVSPKDALAVQEPTLSGAPTSQVDTYKEMGAKRLDDQNGTLSGSDEVLKDLSLRMKEIADQEGQRDYENRSDPFKVYQSQTQQWMKKRTERREKEFEQERRKEFEKELERERTIELDRIKAERDAALKQTPKVSSPQSTPPDAEKKASEVSATEEKMYKAYAEQEGVSVEQVKEWVKAGKIRTSDVTARDRAWMIETP